MKNVLILIFVLSFSLNATASWYDPFGWFDSSSKSESRSRSKSDDNSSDWYNPMSWFGSDSKSESKSYSRSSSKLFSGYEIMGGAEMPYQFGARFKVDVTRDYYIIAGAGFNADFLAGINEAVVTNLGQVPTEDGTFIGQSMKGGIALDIMAGMNFSSYKNFSLQAGYSYLSAAGGEINGLDISQALLPFPVNIGGTGVSEVQSTVHSIKIEANYKWKLSKFYVYGTLGLIKPVMSTTTASNIFNFFEKDQFEDYIDDLIKPLFIPTAALWVSYPF